MVRLLMLMLVLGVALGGSVWADNSTAQGVALENASAGRLRHLGGNPGYEGIGFSTVSADAAVCSSCYWGQLPVAEIGVARGATGWFACVRYQSNGVAALREYSSRVVATVRSRPRVFGGLRRGCRSGRCG